MQNCCRYSWSLQKKPRCVENMEMWKQAGAELCQAQVKLEVAVEFGVEFGVEFEACHY